MLSKLLKHEFAATARFMWVIYAAMVVLSFGANIALRLMDQVHSGFLNAMMVLMLVAWVAVLVVGSAMSLVLLIRRFYKNYLTDEGYLMFTLPVNVHELVLSKLITAAVWILVTMFVVALSCVIAVFQSSFVKDLFDFVQQIMSRVTTYYALNGTAIVLEVLVLLFLGGAATCLQFYSAMAIGHGFTNHKALWSIIAFFVIQVILQILGTILMMAFGNTGVLDSMWNVNTNVGAMQAVHLTMLGTVALELIVSAIYYVITVVNLQKRLNLS